MNKKYISVKYNGFSIEEQIKKGQKGKIKVQAYKPLYTLISNNTHKKNLQEVNSRSGEVYKIDAKLYHYIAKNVFDDYVNNIPRDAILLICSFYNNNNVVEMNLIDSTQDKMIEALKNIIKYIAEQLKFIKYTKTTTIAISINNVVKKEVKKEKIGVDYE